MIQRTAEFILRRHTACMLLLIPDCYRIPFALTEKTSSLIKSKFECGLQKPIKTYLLEKFQKFPFENFPLKTKRMRKSPLFNKYFEKKNFSNKSVQFSLRNGNSNFHFNILSIQNYIWEKSNQGFSVLQIDKLDNVYQNENNKSE